MKHVRFYEEFKISGLPAGTVVAAFTGNGTHGPADNPLYESLSALFDYADSPVAYSAVSVSYLKTRCRRVSESTAREIHPALFSRLDAARYSGAEFTRSQTRTCPLSC